MVLASGEDQGWFTVREAAAYLSVSQPTIFRWMREGSLSYYKVGGSTRFTRETLDAVIEKTTSSKEAESAGARCSACGHSILVEGHLQGNSRTYFRPSKTRFWTLEEAMVPVVAKVCTACGFVQLQADVTKLSRLMPKVK
jgi:excisionase family DNA binding protein